MRLKRSISYIFFITAVSLVYISLQVQIYDLGYRGERKKTELIKQKDINNDLLIHIWKLESADHLGVKLLSEGSPMEFLDSKRIVKLNAPALNEEGYFTAETAGLAQKTGFWTSLFTLKSQAEAQTVRKNR